MTDEPMPSYFAARREWINAIIREEPMTTPGLSLVPGKGEPGAKLTHYTFTGEINGQRISQTFMAVPIPQAQPPAQAVGMAQPRSYVPANELAAAYQIGARIESHKSVG